MRAAEQAARNSYGKLLSILSARTGDIASAEDAWERIKAGSSLIQLYSAMVYEGPGLGAKIVRGLERLMEREGYSTIAEAVGSE